MMGKDQSLTIPIMNNRQSKGKLFQTPSMITQDPELFHSQVLFLFKQERCIKYRPRTDYMETVQRSCINSGHRREVVDWIYQLTTHYKFESFEAFHVTVNLLDRIASLHHIQLQRYQNLAAACFLVASKMVETVPPTCEELRDLSNGAFDTDALKCEELLVLKRLKWDLSIASPLSFLEFFTANFPLDDKQELQRLFELADVFLAVIQSVYYMIQYLPSVQGAASLLAACVCTGHKCIYFYQHVAKELDVLSKDMVALSMGLELPQMRDIDLCAKDILVIIRQLIPKFRYVMDPRDLVYSEQLQCSKINVDMTPRSKHKKPNHNNQFNAKKESQRSIRSHSISMRDYYEVKDEEEMMLTMNASPHKNDVSFTSASTCSNNKQGYEESVDQIEEYVSKTVGRGMDELKASKAVAAARTLPTPTEELLI